jgi:hypothetical protein
MIEKLRPETVTISTHKKFGQCEHPLGDMCPSALGPPGWRKRRMGRKGLDPDRCCRAVSYEINGKKLCSGHAGQLALAILLEQHNQNLPS